MARRKSLTRSGRSIHRDSRFAEVGKAGFAAFRSGRVACVMALRLPTAISDAKAPFPTLPAGDRRSAAMRMEPGQRLRDAAACEGTARGKANFWKWMRGGIDPGWDQRSTAISRANLPPRTARVRPRQRSDREIACFPDSLDSSSRSLGFAQAPHCRPALMGRIRDLEANERKGGRGLPVSVMSCRIKVQSSGHVAWRRA